MGRDTTEYSYGINGIIKYAYILILKAKDVGRARRYVNDIVNQLRRMQEDGLYQRNSKASVQRDDKANGRGKA